MMPVWITILFATAAATVLLIALGNTSPRQAGCSLRRTMRRNPMAFPILVLVVPSLIMIGIVPSVAVIAFCAVCFYLTFAWASGEEFDRSEPTVAPHRYETVKARPESHRPQRTERTPRPLAPPPRIVVQQSSAEAEYPEDSIGWLGAFVRGVAMLALLAFGASFFFVSVRDVQVHQPAVHVQRTPFAQANGPLQRVAAKPDVADEDWVSSFEPRFAVHAEDASNGAAKFETIDQPLSHNPDEAYLKIVDGKSESVWLASDQRASAHVAAEDLETRLRDLARHVVAEELGEDADFWTPSSAWLRKTFGSYAVHNSASGEVRLTQMAVEIRPDRQLLDAIIERFRSDQRVHRALTLGKGYAGAVLIIGGLAIFLRLGTGRRPDRPTLKD